MLSVLLFHGHNQKVLISCPLDFCPLVSFCEENDALRFQVIHCPMNISVLQSIQQLLLRILISYSALFTCWLSNWSFCILLQVTFTTFSVLSTLPSTGMCISFDLHPLQSLLFINWMVVSLLHLCNRSQRMVNHSWRSFHLTAASVVGLLSPFWSSFFHRGLQVCKKTCYQSWT
jgi:hypothetical protein